MDLPIEYGVHDTFNVIDLTPFVSTNEDDLDLRTNPFQGGGDDGRGPSTTSHERQEPRQERLGPSQDRLEPSQERLNQDRLGPRQGRLGQGKEHHGPITRSMAKRLNEDLGQATDGRETNLYMFHEGPSSVA